MININDINKRSRYLNLSNKKEEYDKYHTKSKLLYESNLYRFDDKKFLLQHWESLHENQFECFKRAIDILDEAYENDNNRDFNYIKSYIINEISPTVRDSKQSARYMKYKMTLLKNKVTKNVKKNVEDIKTTTKNNIEKTKETNKKAVSTLKDNTKKSLGQKDIHEAYIQILDTMVKYSHCDRIIENNYNIQKRFNIMNMVENTDIQYDPALLSLIDSICECINTYDTDFATRLNTTLETCFYFLSKKDKNFNKSLVLEEIINNFISGELINENLSDLRSIIESSVVFNNEDKYKVQFIYTSTPFEENAELAKPFLNNEDNNINNLGDTISNISNNITDRDVKKVFSAIRPLFINTGGEKLHPYIKDIKILISKLNSLYTGDNFNKLCYDELQRLKNKRDNKSFEGLAAQNNYLKILEKYGSKLKISESELIMDYQLYDESFSSIKKTAKDIVNDFKLSRRKRPADIRTCISKMFTKSADQIIDGTPNFLSWLRLSYIIGATAINPALGGVTLIVDQFVSMNLKRRDVSKMITVFKNERKNVKEKMKRVDQKDRRNLQEYDKYLKNGLDKLIDYKESLLSNYEKYNNDFGEDYDREKELSYLGLSDTDPNDSLDFDYSLEATDFEKLFEKSNNFSKDYFTNNIKEYISIMKEDTIDIITDIACKYPSIISTNRLYNILKEEYNTIRKESNTTKWIRMSCLTSNIKKLEEDTDEYITNYDCDINVFDVIVGLDDLFTEYSITKSINITNESASSVIKTLTNKLRKLVQKASDVNKEASRRIDSSVNMFLSGMQRASRNENREAIIRGSILPSASKIIKAAILDTGVALVNPAAAVILALGQFATRKKMQKKERQLVLDEIDIELEMCKRYLRQAEDQNDLEAQKKILQIQRNLERQKQRIVYNMKLHWAQDVPDIKKDDD